MILVVCNTSCVYKSQKITSTRVLVMYAYCVEEALPLICLEKFCPWVTRLLSWRWWIATSFTVLETIEILAIFLLSCIPSDVASSSGLPPMMDIKETWHIKIYNYRYGMPWAASGWLTALAFHVCAVVRVVDCRDQWNLYFSVDSTLWCEIFCVCILDQ